MTFNTMVKKIFYSCANVFIPLSIGIFAQDKHSKITDYPTYKGLVMAGYPG
jgi:hypothetical protein